QMEQMQQQMQQMQQQMQEQSAQSVAAVQQALEEQKQLAAQQAAAAVAAATTTDAVIADAAEAGVSTDVLAREQIGGQILTSIENAEINMKSLKNIMQDTFDYAKCDSRGNNCAGPKRVKTFKAKAQKFFDPYESVLDEIYDAVILAQSLGVDINDIYMLLSGGCNRWGRYVCQCVDDENTKSSDTYTGCIKSQAFVYDASNCDTTTNLSKAGTDVNKFVIEGKKCKIGDMIPYNAGGCMPLGPLDGDEPVQEAMLNAENGTSGTQRIGCMSSILDGSILARKTKKAAGAIDIDTLQMLLDQDAPSNLRYDPRTTDTGADVVAPIAYCAIDDTMFEKLERIAARKNLPKEICVDNIKRLPAEMTEIEIPLKWCTNPNINNNTCTCSGATLYWIDGTEIKGVSKITSNASDYCQADIQKGLARAFACGQGSLKGTWKAAASAYNNISQIANGTCQAPQNIEAYVSDIDGRVKCKDYATGEDSINGCKKNFTYWEQECKKCGGQWNNNNHTCTNLSTPSNYDFDTGECVMYQPHS
ncbi:MAG: hypothetical protein ACOX7D_00665, partial [Alphaproteobacteria bacterium]